MNESEKRSYIAQSDFNERRVGWIAAVLGFLLTLWLVVPYMVTRKYIVTPSITPKGKTCPSVGPHIPFRYSLVNGKGQCEYMFPPSHFILDLVVPLVLVAVVVAAVLFRRRTFLAFALIILGLSMSVYSFLVTLPFLAGGGWIMLRAYRTQKYGAPTAKTVQEGWVPPTPRGGTRRTRAGAGASGSRRKSGAEPPSRKPPSANKRYTPKTPPKPAKKTAAR